MIFTVFSGLISLFFTVLSVLYLFFLTEVIVAIVSCHFKTSVADATGDTAGTLTVLIPAHNEERVLQTTLESLQSQLSDGDRILVIVDNCTDSTGEIAQSMGVETLERVDTDRRGKGYALDFGLKSIAANPPDVVLVMDADCTIQPESLQQLKQQALQSKRPVQAVYLMAPPETPTLKDQVSTFAFRVKNLVRPLGLTRLNLPCLLTGTGMAFPWSIISNINMASSEIVEDMKLGLDLAIAGHFPLLCPDALVVGKLPSKLGASTSQRTRWEHGHLQLLQRYVPRLLANAIRTCRPILSLIALDLAIPPLSLLVIIWTGLAAAAVGLGFISGIWVPMLLAMLSGSILFSAVLMAWLWFGRQDLPLQSLLLFPFYILWKIPLYLGFLLKPQDQWIRTERDI